MEGLSQDIVMAVAQLSLFCGYGVTLNMSQTAHTFL